MTTHFNDMTAKSAAVTVTHDNFQRRDHLSFEQSNDYAVGYYARYFKRAFDIIAVAISLPLIVPFILAMAILVAKDGGRPFYKQQRIGKNGRVFTMWKLRTMMNGADAYLDQYLAENSEAKREWETSQKLQNDPRITTVGRLLRKSSMDELPQLWNVLKGDMSLVGPRPMMVSQESIYPGKAYFKVLPGVTGNWQVSERNETSFIDRARYDNQYVNRMSLATDLKLLFATVMVVINGTGR